MSVEAKIDKIAQDLRHVGLAPVKQTTSTKTNKKSDSIADSWEDDTSESDDETRSPLSEQSTFLEAPGPTHLKSPTSRAVDAQRELDGDTLHLPHPPPPTPISPSMAAIKPDWSPSRGLSNHPTVSSVSSAFSSPRSTPPILSSNPTPRHGTPEPVSSAGDRRRPEKTTATANRLIAGALGIRAPPKTEEQRKYDRAVKEQEIKRRNKEKEQKAKEAEEDEKAKAAMWST